MATHRIKMPVVPFEALSRGFNRNGSQRAGGLALAALALSLLLGCRSDPGLGITAGPDGSGGSSGLGGAATPGRDAGGSAAPSTQGGAPASTGSVEGAAAGTPSMAGEAPMPDSYPLPRAPVVDLTNAQRWSDPATWGGQLPAAGADVMIPQGKVVLLDQSAVVGELHVQGTLACDSSKDEALSAHGIVVHGTFACGSQDTPYHHQLTVTLAAPPADAMEAGGIVVMDGGLLELFGEPRRGWTQLAKTVSSGATTISLVEALALRENDRLVLASTDFDPNQAEEAVVAEVTDSTVKLKEPLKWLHWGELQMYPNDVPGAPSVLDERAEVALLSRNIVIQGDEASENTGFGAHVMTMGSGRMFVSGVELYRVGQKSRLGRYPLHWHHADDATGQFIADTSIHHSFNRCVTIHATQNATLLRNVCYDHVGHGYFLEDGVETGNLLAFNLGLGSHAPSESDAILISDTGKHAANGDRDGPATFWIANPDNTLLFNHAAGSDGTGFWFPPKTGPTGDSAGVAGVAPKHVPVRKFSGDVAHSSQIGLLLSTAVENGVAEGDVSLWYLPDSPSVFESFTGYKIRGDTGGQSGVVWLSGGNNVVFRGMVTADSRHAYNFAYDVLIEKGLVVGLSANLGTPATDEEKRAGRALPMWEILGIGLYDGPHHFRDLYFAGFDANPFRATTTAIQEITGTFTAPNNLAEGFGVAPGSVRFNWDRPASANSGLLDVDGSVSGHAGWYVTGSNPVMRDSSCEQLQVSPSVAYACPGPELSFTTKLPGADVGDMTLTRTTDGAQAVVPKKAAYQTNVLSDYDYEYAFKNPESLGSQVLVRLDTNSTKAGNWVTVNLPVAWGSVFVYPWSRANWDSDAGGDDIKGGALVPRPDIAALKAGSTGYVPSARGVTLKLVVPEDGAGAGLRVCRSEGCSN